jgi:hypothetical protein
MAAVINTVIVSQRNTSDFPIYTNNKPQIKIKQNIAIHQ